MANKNFVEQVSLSFVERIVGGTAIWQNDARVLPSMPLTVADERDVPLSGGNALVLAQAMIDKGWRDPRFLTHEQVVAAGASVLAGNRSIDVQFARSIGADGSLLEQPEIAVYSLFNAEQVEGLRPWIAPERAWTLASLAERLLPKFEVGIVHDQEDRAFFSGVDGNVHMPPMSSFPSLGDYVGVAVHELSHASRGELGRMVEGEVGEPSFAREELRAELASMQLSIALGIPHDTVRHAGFAEEWAPLLRADPGELFRAARDAEMMAALVLWHVQAVERELAAERAMEADKVAKKVIYTVSAAQNFEQQDFSSPVDAAAAFHGIDGNDRPIVVRTERGAEVGDVGRAAIIAQTVGRSEPGQARVFGKTVGKSDEVFEAAYLELAANQGVKQEGVPSNPVPSAAEKRRDYQKGVYADRAAELFADRQTVLAVPFSDRDEAKRLGAVFYSPQKLWFVPAGIDSGLFKKWSAIEGVSVGAVMPSPDAIIADFERAMDSLGLSTEKAIKADGLWHHVKIYDHHKSNTSGSYILHLDGGRDGRPSGTIMNRLSGETLAWRMDIPGLSQEQQARMRAEAWAREAFAAKELAQRQEAVAAEALSIWSAAQVSTHGYFELKGVKGHGARVVDGSALLGYSAFKGDGGATIIRAQERYALLPLMDDAGKLWALQAISEDGKTKAFMSGGRKKGLFCVINGSGAIDDSKLPTSGQLGFAEGFATGATVQERCGFPVVVCFDAGNMEAVAKELGQRLGKDVTPVIAADNDQFFMERALGALARIGVVAQAKEPFERTDVPSIAGVVSHVSPNCGHPWNRERAGFDIMEFECSTDKQRQEFTDASKKQFWDTWMGGTSADSSGGFCGVMYKPSGINSPWHDSPERPHPGGEVVQKVQVMAGPDETREIAMGGIVADGTWHQAVGGRYRLVLEADAARTECCGKVTLEIVRAGSADGQKETLRAGNRGMDAARVAAAAMQGSMIAVPKFDGLTGRPTDWNDLAKRGGDVRGQVDLLLGKQCGQTLEGNRNAKRSCAVSEGRGR